MTARQSAGMYDFLSSNSHPTLYPLRQVRRWAQHAGHQYGSILLDLDHLERLAAAAVLGFYNALAYAIGFYDAGRATHKRLTACIAATMPSVFLRSG